MSINLVKTYFKRRREKKEGVEEKKIIVTCTATNKFHGLEERKKERKETRRNRGRIKKTRRNLKISRLNDHDSLSLGTNAALRR